jgi:hypothetical protein
MGEKRNEHTILVEKPLGSELGISVSKMYGYSQGLILVREGPFLLVRVRIGCVTRAVFNAVSTRRLLFL